MNPSPSPTDRICVVIGRTRQKMMQIEIQEAAKRGARMIEVRLDFLAKAPRIKELLASKPCPFVVTVRRHEDGGRWGGTEDARQALLRQAIVDGFDWVDLETDVADAIRRQGRQPHRQLPQHARGAADLENIHAKMCKQDADVVKIEARPAPQRQPPRPEPDQERPEADRCVLPGRHGHAQPGARRTPAAVHLRRVQQGARPAPGLPSFEEMGRVYHYGLVNADTKVFGVVGDPVGHSLSPVLHNVAMRQLQRRLSAVPVPRRVRGVSQGV
jgi:3-dehydroquinate dehydratase/shikimate dehydrogenase